MQKENNCGCVGFETTINPATLARAYVPFQSFCSVYEGDKGLLRGTVFPELYSSYCKNPMKECKEKKACKACK